MAAHSTQTPIQQTFCKESDTAFSAQITFEENYPNIYSSKCFIPVLITVF